MRDVEAVKAFFSPRMLAEYLDVPIQTIYQWRHNGTGPRGIKVGKHTRYRVTEVERWLDSQSAS